MNCIHCNRKLGANPILPELPLGLRVAFDPAHGRVWTICDHCGNWNLGDVDDDSRPLLIERLEKFYLATPSHTETHGIGVAQLPNGASLVRIGDTTWRQFAAWRYGQRLTRRNKKFWALIAVGIPVSLWLLSPWGDEFMDSWVAIVGFHLLFWPPLVYLTYRGVFRLPPSTSVKTVVRPTDIAHTELEITDKGWRVHIAHRQGASVLEGHEAIAVLARAIPWAYSAGGKPSDIEESIALIERAGGPRRFFETRLTPEWIGAGRHKIARLPPVLLNAIEMAAHEETERRVAGSDLTLLTLQSANASETAAIADEAL